MTIFVTWQLIVTLDSIRNSCDVYYILYQFVCDFIWNVSNVWWPHGAHGCDVYTERPVAHLETAPPPPLPTWPSRPAHSALFTGPCNAQIHQPEQFLSRPGIFFSPKNRPYFGCGIYIYIVDAVKKTRRNITQFLSSIQIHVKRSVTWIMWQSYICSTCQNIAESSVCHHEHHHIKWFKHTNF